MNENRDVFKQGNTLTDIDYKRKIIDEFLLTEESYQKVYDGDTHFHPERDNYWVYHNILETKLYEEEVRIFNKLKDYGLTENHLRARNYWLFRSEHFEALTALVLERDFTVRDALLELDMLSVEEAKAVKNGLRKAEVKGKDSDQIHILWIDCKVKEHKIANDFITKYFGVFYIYQVKSEGLVLDLISKFLKDYDLRTVKHIKDIISYIENYLLEEIVNKGYRSVLQKFIRFGANLNRKNTASPRRSLLMDACESNHENSARLLLEFGADVFAKDEDDNTALMWTSSEAIARLLIEKAIEQGRLVQLLEAKNALGETALMRMCSQNRKEIVELLLDKQANLLVQSNNGRAALMYAASSELCECLIRAAKNRNQLQELITIVDQNQHTAFDKFVNAGNTDNAKCILPLVTLFCNTRSLQFALSNLRKAYFIYPSKAKEFDAICMGLRIYVKQSVKEMVGVKHGNLMLEFSPLVETFSTAYHFLYRQGYVEKNIINKDDAIKHVIAEIYILLENAKEFMMYSGCLSQMFEFYFYLNYGSSFPEVDKSSYEFKPFSFFCPVPKENYEKMNKKHSLPVFLMLFLRVYGLAKEARKWVGPVPHEIANETIKNGFFVTEDDEFHVKYAHMWQWAVIVFYLCVIKKSASLKYGLNKEHKLEMRDVFSGLVTLKKAPEFKHILWLYVLDANDYTYLTFSGPASITALMKYGQLEQGMPCRAVADYFVDIFCGLRKKHYRQVIKNSFYANLSFDEFLDKLKDLEVEQLFFADGRFNEIMANERLKNRLIESIDEKQQYAVIIKNYGIKPTENLVQNFLEKKLVRGKGEDGATFKQRETIANYLKLLFVSQLSTDTKSEKVSDNYWAPD